MAVMQVWVVRVPMHMPRMLVPVSVRFARRLGVHVLMLVVLVVIMPVLVPHCLVDMLVLVPFGQM
jgi:hypothetical protein